MAILSGVDPLVTQQGVIDQFNFIIANITRSDWQILTVELVDFTAVQKPDANSNVGDFSGLVFVEPTGNIVNSPNAHRVFIRFKDSAGDVRGAMTTAVRTQ